MNFLPENLPASKNTCWTSQLTLNNEKIECLSSVESSCSSLSSYYASFDHVGVRLWLIIKYEHTTLISYQKNLAASKNTCWTSQLTFNNEKIECLSIVKSSCASLSSYCTTFDHVGVRLWLIIKYEHTTSISYHFYLLQGFLVRN